MTTTTEPPTRVATTPPASYQRRRRGGRWLVMALVLLAAAAIAFFVLRPDDSDAPVETEVTQTFVDVVRTDLSEESSYSGTLGRTDGLPITSRLGGTITSVPAAGTTISTGELLFQVDDTPVMLLEGDVPAWRSIGIEASGEDYRGHVTGVVTVGAEAGSILEQGDVLHSVGNVPVIVLYGETPAYRSMGVGDIGPDVLQVEQALVALGYDTDGLMTVDEEFTSYTSTLVALWQADVGLEEDGVVELGSVMFIPQPAFVTSVQAAAGESVSAGQPVVSLATGTAVTGADVEQLETALAAAGYNVGVVDAVFTQETRRAVIEWQADMGADQDGTLDLGEVVFLPEPIRVAETVAAVGQSVNPGGTVLAVTSNSTVVTVDLPAEDQGLLTEGMSVTVDLPGDVQTPGTVMSVSTVASVAQGDATVFPVEITLDDPDVAGNLDEAPVDVLVVTDAVNGVVAVPVTALIALAEGGYAVEVETTSGTALVGVEPGFFADGLVEVLDSGLEPGDRVVIP